MRFAPAFWIAAAWIPLQAVYPIAKVFAGKHTEVALTVSVSIGISLALGGAMAAMTRRAKAQNREILRLLERCASLEAQLGG
jgi:hypothetical protein